jgi:hypothetical protein
MWREISNCATSWVTRRAHAHRFASAVAPQKARLSGYCFTSSLLGELLGDLTFHVSVSSLGKKLTTTNVTYFFDHMHHTLPGSPCPTPGPRLHYVETRSQLLSLNAQWCCL